jgi:hypothetical protein
MNARVNAHAGAGGWSDLIHSRIKSRRVLDASILVTTPISHDRLRTSFLLEVLLALYLAS